MRAYRTRNRNILFVVGISAFLVLVGGGLDEVWSEAAELQAESLLLSGPDSAAELQRVLVGRGIPGVSVLPYVAAEGEIAWEAFRDETDALGMRHVFYRQVLLAGPALARILSGADVDDGIPLIGAELGVHWENGVIDYVAGTQYRSFSLALDPAVTSERIAYQLTQDALQD